MVLGYWSSPSILRRSSLAISRARSSGISSGETTTRISRPAWIANAWFWQSYAWRARDCAYFASVTFDPKVVASAESQPEFVRPIWDYVMSAVSADRIERGRDSARSESLWLARAKDIYGVDDAVILGVWGMETDFGGFAGRAV